ncbi:MAG: CopG family transcriptional regulator [Planctomycetia bacterium]|nr:MAG: CopG family transcriptional regulator [Planctomycetia bacterium]
MSAPESGGKVTLKIPAELYAKLSEMIDGTGFRSVTEFAVYVLRDVAAGGKLEPKAQSIGQVELDAIRTRLRALGYIE